MRETLGVLLVLFPTGLFISDSAGFGVEFSLVWGVLTGYALRACERQPMDAAAGR
jgi:hypothetical protein